MVNYDPFPIGSSLSDQVHQTPADMFQNQGQTATINCSHSIDGYDRILWFKQTKSKQLHFLGYMFENLRNPEPGVNVTMAGNANKDETCTLTIADLTVSSSAVYLPQYYLSLCFNAKTPSPQCALFEDSNVLQQQK